MIKRWFAPFDLFEKRRLRKQKEFAARLKWGKDWHYNLYPHKYTKGTGPR